MFRLFLLQCRLRGKLDSNGVVGAFLEERLNMGVNMILSAEVRKSLAFASWHVYLVFSSEARIIMCVNFES